MRYQNKKDPLSPKGSNKLGALDSYNESVYYDIVFPQALYLANPISLRAEIRGLYGKVDPTGYSVVPKSKYLSQLDSEDSETHNVLYIVKECFEELVQYYSKLSARGKLSEDSISFKDIKPRRAWSSLMSAYATHQYGIVNAFIAQKDSNSAEIKDYKSFEKSFMKFCKTLQIPLTASGYGVSRLSSPLSSGLVIDLALEDASEDRVKYEGFLKDSNFVAFRKVVNRFGFRFDIDVPWRIYFDVSHEYSKEKMAKYGINNVEEFFSKYYNRIVRSEIGAIGKILHDAYNKFYTNDSTYTIPKGCNNGSATRIETVEREVVTMQKLASRYSDQHWIRVYTYFRALETKKKWNQAKFDKVVREASDLYKYRGLDYMYKYLEPHFLDRSNELFQKRDLTKENSFDRIITDFRF